jgi:hypothetical protein
MARTTKDRRYGGTLRRFRDIGILYGDESRATTIACRGVVIQGFTPSASQSTMPASQGDVRASHSNKLACVSTTRASHNNMRGEDPDVVRKLGKHYCRVGLPKVHFTKIYSAIASHHPDILKNVEETDRYGQPDNT